MPCLGWEKPLGGVSKFVGMSGDRIYLLNPVGQLFAIDHNTGTRVASVSGSEITMVLPNHQTDRLYVGTKKGLLRCYRESSKTYPVFHANDGEAMMDDANMKPGDAEKPGADDAAEDDPFAEESDPFATDDGSDPFASDEDESASDPFGGSSDESSDDEDPFGGDDDSSDESDPFGGGEEESEEEDPFGGI